MQPCRGTSDDRGAAFVPGPGVLVAIWAPVGPCARRDQWALGRARSRPLGTFISGPHAVHRTDGDVAMRLLGKVALVTGATYGIGTTIVERMAEEGASVVFTGRSADKGDAIEAAMQARDLDVTYCQGDAGVEDDVRRAVDTTVETYGTITTVVNNAAATDITRPGGGDSHVTEITNEAF